MSSHTGSSRPRPRVKSSSFSFSLEHVKKQPHLFFQPQRLFRPSPTLILLPGLSDAPSTRSPAHPPAHHATPDAITIATSCSPPATGKKIKSSRSGSVVSSFTPLKPPKTKNTVYAMGPASSLTCLPPMTMPPLFSTYNASKTSTATAGANSVNSGSSGNSTDRKSSRIVGRGGSGSRPRPLEIIEPLPPLPSPLPHFDTGLASEVRRLIGRGGLGSRPRNLTIDSTHGAGSYEHGTETPVASTSTHPPISLPIIPPLSVIPRLTLSNSASASTDTLNLSLNDQTLNGDSTPRASASRSNSILVPPSPAPSSHYASSPAVGPTPAPTPIKTRFGGRGGAGSKPRVVKIVEPGAKAMRRAASKPDLKSKSKAASENRFKLPWIGKPKLTLAISDETFPPSFSSTDASSRRRNSISTLSPLEYKELSPTGAQPQWSAISPTRSWRSSVTSTSSEYLEARRRRTNGMNKLAKLLGAPITEFPYALTPATKARGRSSSISSQATRRDSIPSLYHSNPHRESSLYPEDLHQLDLNADDLASERFSLAGSVRSTFGTGKRRSSIPDGAGSPITFSNRPPAEHLANQDDDSPPYVPPPARSPRRHSRSNSTPLLHSQTSPSTSFFIQTTSEQQQQQPLPSSSFISFSPTTPTSATTPTWTLSHATTPTLRQPSIYSYDSSASTADFRQSLETLDSAFSSTVSLGLYEPQLREGEHAYNHNNNNNHHSPTPSRSQTPVQTPTQAHTRTHTLTQTQPQPRTQTHSQTPTPTHSRGISHFTDPSFGMERTSLDDDNHEYGSGYASYHSSNGGRIGEVDVDVDGGHGLGGSVNGRGYGGGGHSRNDTVTDMEWSSDWSHEDMQDVIRILRGMR